MSSSIQVKERRNRPCGGTWNHQSLNNASWSLFQLKPPTAWCKSTFRASNSSDQSRYSHHLLRWCPGWMSHLLTLQTDSAPTWNLSVHCTPSPNLKVLSIHLRTWKLSSIVVLKPNSPHKPPAIWTAQIRPPSGNKRYVQVR